MAREKAEEHRRLLMEDRKPGLASNGDNNVSLVVFIAGAAGN